MSTFLDNLAQLATKPEWEDFSSLRNCRFLIGSLFYSLLSAPENLRLSFFERLHERDIERGVKSVAQIIDALGGRVLTAVEKKETTAFERGVHVLRLLDQIAHETPRVQSNLSISELSYDEFFVVPCTNKFDRRAPFRGQMLRRRGLKYHRVIKRQIDGLQVELHQHNDIPEAAGSHSRLIGLSLFKNLNFTFDKHEGNSFLACDAICDGQSIESAILYQTELARSRSCTMLVWPELTLPPSRVELIEKDLADRHLSREYPPVVVAGSWHVSDGSDLRNRCTVLDGRGEVMFFQDKALPFLERNEIGLTERVESSKVIKLLFTETELLGIFICLDFCHTGREQLLMHLDLSLIVVPSMGAATTMGNHVLRERALSTETGARTVVVQQLYPVGSEPNGMIGFLLASPSSPSGTEAHRLATSQQFSSFFLD